MIEVSGAENRLFLIDVNQAKLKKLQESFSLQSAAWVKPDEIWFVRDGDVNKYNPETDTAEETGLLIDTREIVRQVIPTNNKYEHSLIITDRSVWKFDLD